MHLIKIILVVFFCTSFATENKCTDFHTGTFDLNDAKIGYHTIIVRTDKFQVETNVENGNKTKCAVRWIDDCTYVLKYLETDSEVLRSLIGSELTIEITKVDGRTAYFTAIMEGYDDRQLYVMNKID